MPLLREKLLAGRRIVLGGAVATLLADALRELGAELEQMTDAQLPADEDHVGDWARARAPLHALVWGGAGAFGSGGERGLNATLEQAWAAVREVALGAMIPAESPAKLLLIAPPRGAGALEGAARAGLENLVRTLSVEWARYGVTSVLIAPGSATTDEELAQLACFIVSEGGAYLSGCRLDVGTVG